MGKAAGKLALDMRAVWVCGLSGALNARTEEERKEKEREKQK